LESQQSESHPVVTAENQDTEQVEQLLETPNLADALESEQFKKFLDQVPIAIAVSDLTGDERIVYVNPFFAKLTGVTAASLVRRRWDALEGEPTGEQEHMHLAAAIVGENDCVGTFRIRREGSDPVIVDAYSNVIEDQSGRVCFRLVALVDVSAHGAQDSAEIESRIRKKDTLLKELQHRVKNNLQMITALIRLEARNTAAPDEERFERLAGRVDALAILYQALSNEPHEDEVDLGVYLSQIASAVMKSHAVEGITLDMEIDTYPVSVNVAMPTGLVVNELLTNSLKHAFRNRHGGTITLKSIVDQDGCQIVVADDGVGMPQGETWPQQGKLGALIVQTLIENARAQFEVVSNPGQGIRVTIRFRRSVAAAAVV
jgi:PAS domain S-box-containing protein